MTWMMYEQYNRPKLTFPLLKNHKYEMLRVLPSNLKELIYSCENPTVADEFIMHNADTINFYGIDGSDFYKYNQFLDHKDKFYKFEPCGECVPCSKIINDSHLFDTYCHSQPIFMELNVHQTIEKYNKLMDRAQWHDQTKKFVNDKFERDNRQKGLWTAVQHPNDDVRKEEMILPDMNDEDARNIANNLVSVIKSDGESKYISKLEDAIQKAASKTLDSDFDRLTDLLNKAETNHSSETIGVKDALEHLAEKNTCLGDSSRHDMAKGM
jgi:hypothetical protein